MQVNPIDIIQLATIILAGLGAGIAFHKYKTDTIRRTAQFEQKVNDSLKVLCKFQEGFERQKYITQDDCKTCKESMGGVNAQVAANSQSIKDLSVKVASFIGRTDAFMQQVEKIYNSLEKREIQRHGPGGNLADG